MAIQNASLIHNRSLAELRTRQAAEAAQRRAELEAARAQVMARQANLEARIAAGETPAYDEALKRSQRIKQTNNQTNNQTTKQTNDNITTLQLAKTGNSLETAGALNQLTGGQGFKIGTGNYTLQNNQDIPESKLKSAEYLKSEGRYNSYSDEMVKRAKDLQQNGNVLQKAAASIYLGANDAAKNYDSFVDNNNKYGVKISQGETHDTGDGFNDFMMDVAGNIALMPSGFIRTMAAGTMAGADIITATERAKGEVFKTGDISIVQKQTERTAKTLGTATVDFGKHTAETFSDPKQLTAIGLTAVAGAGVTGATTRIASGVSKTVKGTKVSSISKTTGKPIVIDNAKGSITINSGKTVTIPIGTKSISITKGRTSTGAKVRDVTIQNNAGQTTKRVSTVKGQTVTENKPITDAVTGIKAGNIEITSTAKTTLIRGKNRGIVTEKRKNQAITAKDDSKPAVGMNIRGNVKTIDTGKVRSTKFIKVDKSGNIRVNERNTGKVTRRNIATNYVEQNTRARINTIREQKTERKTEIKKEGETVKTKTKNKTTGTADINVDINIGNTKNQLPGKTTKSRNAGTTIKFNKGELIVVDKNVVSGNKITISTGNKRTSITKAGTAGIKHKSTSTDTITPNRRRITSTIKNVERPKVAEKAKVRTEQKNIKAKAKEDKKKAKAENKAERKRPIEIVGEAMTDSNGRVTRYFPKGYVKAVKRVNRQIHTGRLSKADKDFLQNRRDNKMGKSGDAEALYGRRQMMKTHKALDKKRAKEARKTEEVKGVRIDGIATFNSSGRITRYIPEGYKEAVLKVHRDIKKGKLSKDDKDFLQNRRDNKFSESGDAEALYGRRQIMKAQAESDARKAAKEGKPKIETKQAVKTRTPKTRRIFTKKSNSKNSGITIESDNTHYVDAGNGMMYAMKTKSKTTSKPQSTTPVKQQQQQKQKQTKQQKQDKPKTKPIVATTGGIYTANQTLKQDSIAIRPGQQQQQKPATTTSGNGTVLIKKESTTTSGTTTTGNHTTTNNNKTNSDSRKGTTKPKTKTETKEAVKRTAGTAIILGTAVKPAVKQAVRQETKKESRTKKKTRALHLDEENKKKRKVIKSKKPKTAIRIETINQFGWLGLDTKKAAKARKIRI